MKIIYERDSVCLGDDINAPHTKVLFLEQPTSIEQIINEITKTDVNFCHQEKRNHLSSWSVVTDGVFWGVVSNKWKEVKMKCFLSEKEEQKLLLAKEIKLYFNYHQQHDPETIFSILSNLKLTVKS